MLLAAILLLSPIPQNWDAAKVVVDPPAVDSSSATKDSSLSQPLPSLPEPKVKTDAEAAGNEDLAEAAGSPAAFIRVEPVQPYSAPRSFASVKPAGSRDYEVSSRHRKLWYALTVTGSGAAVFDAWSTRRAISQGYATEANPLLRPFAHSGMMYAATQASPLLMDFLGKRMMTSQHGWMRRMWWLPQAAGSGVSIAAGVHNVRLVQ
jgi:hypothetical protein